MLNFPKKLFRWSSSEFIKRGDYIKPFNVAFVEEGEGVFN